MTGVTKSNTTSYHPMGNGMTERCNRKLIGMLGTLATNHKRNLKYTPHPPLYVLAIIAHCNWGQTYYSLAVC